MREHATFFVEEGTLCARVDGEVVQIKKWRRRLRDTEVTPVFPHICGRYLVLVASNRPVGVLRIYANGTIKEEMIPDAGEYTYIPVTTPLYSKKKPRR